MINTERIHGLALRWHAAISRRSKSSDWDASVAKQSILHLIVHFPELPALEIMDWVAGTIESGDGPMTFGDVDEVASPMVLIPNDYRGFRMVMALCPIRC